MTAWIEVESIMLREISQGVKDKYHNLTYKWNLINETNKQAKYNQGHCNKNKLRGEGRGVNGERRGRVVQEHV